MAQGSLADPDEVAKRYVDVVENIRNVALRDGRGDRRPGRLAGR